jgi:hypothetical protein
MLTAALEAVGKSMAARAGSSGVAPDLSVMILKRIAQGSAWEGTEAKDRAIAPVEGWVPTSGNSLLAASTSMVESKKPTALERKYVWIMPVLVLTDSRPPLAGAAPLLPPLLLLLALLVADDDFFANRIAGESEVGEMGATAAAVT